MGIVKNIVALLSTIVLVACTQTFVVDKPINPMPEPNITLYRVGDYYNENGKEGVVFEISDFGKHGKIVSMKQSRALQWSSDSAEQDRSIGADSSADGMYNMMVVKDIPDWDSTYPVFKWCADFGEEWYLPSRFELEAMYANKEELNHHLTDKIEGSYWSSTENSSGVWIVYMDNGDLQLYHKSYHNTARAVTNF